MSKINVFGWLDTLIDCFMVYDELKESGWRPSETLVTSAILVLSSAGILMFGVGISEVEAAAIAAGIVGILNFVLRLRSKGGESKVKIKKAEVKQKKILEESE
jgi:hypothetical protein